MFLDMNHKYNYKHLPKENVTIDFCKRMYGKVTAVKKNAYIFVVILCTLAYLTLTEIII